jgi:hypothetical protein
MSRPSLGSQLAVIGEYFYAGISVLFVLHKTGLLVPVVLTLAVVGLVVAFGLSLKNRRDSTESQETPSRKRRSRALVPGFSAARGGIGLRCPYCHDDLARHDERQSCLHCKTAYHADCARELKGCATLGCGEAKHPVDPRPSSRVSGQITVRERAFA